MHSKTVITLVISSYLSIILSICSRFQQLLQFYYLIPSTFHQCATTACIIHAVCSSSTFGILQRNDVSNKPQSQPPESCTIKLPNKIIWYSLITLNNTSFHLIRHLGAYLAFRERRTKYL